MCFAEPGLSVYHSLALIFRQRQNSPGVANFESSFEVPLSRGKSLNEISLAFTSLEVIRFTET